MTFRRRWPKPTRITRQDNVILRLLAETTVIRKQIEALEKLYEQKRQQLVKTLRRRPKK